MDPDMDPQKKRKLDQKCNRNKWKMLPMCRGGGKCKYCQVQVQVQAQVQVQVQVQLQIMSDKKMNYKDLNGFLRPRRAS